MKQRILFCLLFALSASSNAGSEPECIDRDQAILVGGVAECTKCHGPGNTAWQEPAPRVHPLAPVPVRTWAAACGSCHDSATAQTHFFLQTANGAESCAVCHGKDRENSVELSHKAR